MKLQLIVELGDSKTIVTYEQEVHTSTTLLTIVGHLLGTVLSVMLSFRSQSVFSGRPIP